MVDGSPGAAKQFQHNLSFIFECSKQFQMEDLEQQCEDALFEVCDARERYPMRCADELQKCIKLNNEINMMKVARKTSVLPNDAANKDDQTHFFNNNSLKENVTFEHLDNKLNKLRNKLDNLKAVSEQKKRETECVMNKLLEK